ncbi:MAG: hypothetical protein QQN55_01000 [Nitrosopumilus sp.]
MIKFLGLFMNALGIGGDLLKNRAKRKNLESEQRHEIIKAETNAEVDRIMSNTTADNEIDLITAKQKSKTIKDDIVTYMFLVPVMIATASPFIIAWKQGDFTNLAKDIETSYNSLNALPDWYKYVLYAVIIDVLGFRSFTRKLMNTYINKIPKAHG